MDPAILSDALLRREREKAAGLVLALKCRLLRNLEWGEYLDTRQHLSYAMDRLAMVEGEMARRERDA